jgi:CheY-like chemotaxis protein
VGRLSHESEPMSPAGTIVDTTALAGRKVLVVEDEPLIAMMIEDMLDDLGCTLVGSAANLQQALSIAEVETIDVALLDMNLNGTSSVPIADRLAERRVPFVFATGYGAEGRAAAHNGAPVLKKPFDQGELARALNEAFKPKPA